MSRILALIVAPAAFPGASLAADLAAAETVQAVADYEGPHIGGIPAGMLAVTAGFVVAGAWLLWASSRSRG